jgi:phosphohistidine phosphatase
VKLYLIRHGEAESGNLDSARRLTQRGKMDAQKAALWLKNIIDGPVSLWSSPYIRAQQTAHPIAKALSVEIEYRECLKPDVSPQTVIDELIHQKNSIILVAHLPLVGRLASLLMDGVVLDQPWSAAEIWQLQGSVFAPSCLENMNVWYPALCED